ncbi:nuclease-related domain-containing DEAD/DEAH box helicase [Caviibacterium pharyngocola]|uniref:NERD domain-containing protein n=1 Tax=Caviibacterium pharyngocola TaxID=28159 RepID=A0A2M8RYU7_9PAST|nr:NERD domain-containing protein [Caviibacterium pharyngocola]PJG84055.1 hypothetical protein CVP04_00970 [Caviibacterium pharyngocola]
MKMIPNIPYSTNSQAEKRIFEQLRPLFNEQDYYAFHSLNLTLHNYKRAGEIDFLILCPLGLYVLEIKGGRIQCQEGKWFFTNRWGEYNSKPESPFKQAETALYGIMGKLCTQFSPDFMRNIAIGYGVILPDCQLNVSGAEWDRAQLCDNGQYRHLEIWLKHLFSYYRQRNQQNKYLNSEQIRKIAAYLRPNFESVIPLCYRNEQALDEIHSLTEDQIRIIDAVENNQRILCEGGAGTGKTFLAIELAKIWATQGLQVGVICHSSWLKNYLQHHNRIKNVYYSTALGLKQSLNRAGLNHFDALIIDEAQDLLRFEYLEKLHSSVNQGLEQGKWACFLDINNQSGFSTNLNLKLMTI